MKGIWYDTLVYPNVRYCSKCKRKIATNKKDFDFTIPQFKTELIIRKSVREIKN